MKYVVVSGIREDTADYQLIGYANNLNSARELGRSVKVIGFDVFEIATGRIVYHK